jgi:hypothetical protein
MQKLLYLLWSPAGQLADAYADKLLRVSEDSVLALKPAGATLFVADYESRVPSPSPGLTCRRPPSAMLSLWLKSSDERSAHERILSKQCERFAGYRVDETIYTDWGQNPHGKPRDWADGERSPGVFAITLLERPERCPEQAWFRHWYGTQSPVSEAMQPRPRYVRNVVEDVLTPRAPRYAGIVEEAWPSKRHVTDPYLFYGASDLDELAENMGTMLASVTAFLDLPRIQTVMLSEYVLKTPSS